MNKYKILIIDDEELILRSLEIDLKKRDYDVTITNSGEDGIKKLKETDYDLIITDLIMESLGGIDVLKEAKQKNRETMVMIITGYASITSAVDALRLGASDYMLKPFNKAELFLRIDNCLKKLELQRKIKIYETILPVCCKCKKIRDDSGKKPGTGEWMNMDTYLTNKAKIDISHGYCDECVNELKREIEDMQHT